MTTYESYALTAAEHYEHHFVPTIGTPFAARLLEHAGLRSGERVLDLACGTGVATRLAADGVGPTGTVTGLDANPAMLEVARRVAPQIHWHEAPAEQTGLADASFDVVLCSLGFMFFADKAAALDEMRRVLVPGGRVAIGTPGPTPPLFEAIDEALVAHVGPGASMFVHAVFSLHDPDEMRTLLDEAAFEASHIERTVVPLRVGPPADFFWHYVRSTPLAAVVAELGPAERAALERDVAERCRPFVDGDAAVMEPGLLLATAFRKGAS